jgi:hypothetical protein
MKLRHVLTLFFASAAIPAFAADPASTELLKQALQAQGGEQKLRALKSVSFESTGYRNMLEQSERPEGPYIIVQQELSELHDHANKALRKELQQRMPPELKPFAMTTVVANNVAMRAAGGKQFPGTPQDLKEAAETLALSPERVLVTALDAADAHREADTVLQGVPHQVVAFSLDGAPARIYLNQHTHLPSAVDYAGPLARSGYAGYLGDVVQRVLYSFWTLDAGGVRYPIQWDIEINGMPDRQMQLHALKIDAPIEPGLTSVPAALAAAFKPDALPRELALGADQYEVAPGIVHIHGAYDVAIVAQDDGLVILDAPISSKYSAMVLDEAARRYPGKPVKAVVTTSDAWPHVAGLREYAARGVPIYALDLNEAIVRRTLGAAHAQKPDALQEHPRKPVLRIVRARTAIGAGGNRIELYPLRGEGSERQLMAYFPGHRLLYGSDAFSPASEGGYFHPQTVCEVVQAVEREHLAVDRFFMMHLKAAPYSDLLSLPACKR